MGYTENPGEDQKRDEMKQIIQTENELVPGEVFIK